MSLKVFQKVGSVAALVLALGAGAAAAQTEFRGGGFLTDFTTACQPNGWTGTSQLTARMRPAGLAGNNATNTNLSLFFDTFTYHAQFPSLGFNTNALAVSAGAIGSALTVNPTPMPTVRRLAPPANTAFGAPELHFVADVLNFDGVTGCNARLNLWLYQR